MDTEPLTHIQELLAQLRAKGWTGNAIADELGIKRRTLSDWQAGTHKPANQKLIEAALTQLLDRKRIPKGKRGDRYQGGQRYAKPG